MLPYYASRVVPPTAPGPLFPVPADSFVAPTDATLMPSPSPAPTQAQARVIARNKAKAWANCDWALGRAEGPAPGPFQS